MLEIDNVEESDQGVYKCIATNDVGEASSSAELIVLQEDDATDVDRQPPKIVRKLPSNLETLEGHPVQMELLVKGESKLFQNLCNLYHKTIRSV